MSNYTKGIRSARAVFAGVFANVIIAVPIDHFCHSVGIFPPEGEEMSTGLYLLAFSYRFAAAIIGGYWTSALAPDKPKKHAAILGCVGIALSSIGAAAMWEYGPAWYPLSLVVISLPCSLAGDHLRRSLS